MTWIDLESIVDKSAWSSIHGNSTFWNFGSEDDVYYTA